MRSLLLALLLVGADGRAAAPIDPFLADLQRAVERNDRAAVAGMVHYPMKVLASGWIIPVADRATFVKLFDAFFTDEVKDLVAASANASRAAKMAPVFTLGHDNVRIMRIGASYQIIGIVVPGNSGKVRGARRAPRRVQFDSRFASTSYSGTLASGEHETYIVAVERNELLDVRVDGVRGRDIVARVVDAATGTPLDDRARHGSRIWTGRVPATGDYRIDIVREATGGAAVLTYSLAVALR